MWNRIPVFQPVSGPVHVVCMSALLHPTEAVGKMKGVGVGCQEVRVGPLTVEDA